MPYEVVYDPDAILDLDGFTRRDRVIVEAAVSHQLVHEPAVQTRNRVPMDPNPLVATWELRLGTLRVYYDVVRESFLVRIIAAGHKERERVRLGRGVYIDLRLPE